MFARFPPMLRMGGRGRETRLVSVDEPWMSVIDDGEGSLLDDKMNNGRLDSDRSELSTATTGSDYTTTPGTKRVHFGTSSIRTYPQVLGEHPYCSMGCPLELGWDYNCESECTVDDFEQQYRSSVSSRQCPHVLRLSPTERRAILQGTVTDQEVRKVCRRRNRDRCTGQRKLQREFFGREVGGETNNPVDCDDCEQQDN